MVAIRTVVIERFLHGLSVKADRMIAVLAFSTDATYFFHVQKSGAKHNRGLCFISLTRLLEVCRGILVGVLASFWPTFFDFVL